MYLMPNAKHARKYRPRQFKRYQSYKRFLQHEFVRTCVYCRQVDTAAPNVAYTVDHFKPKGRAEFAHLKNVYANLYYCCPACNSRKKDYWPLTGADDRFVNPCDDVMAEHLRFDSKTGLYVSHSTHGKFMIDLLQLNDEDVVSYRKATLTKLQVLQRALDQCSLDRQQLDRDFAKGKVTAAQHAAEVQELLEDSANLSEAIAISAGTKPPMALPKRGWTAV